MSDRHWSVEVRVNGENVLNIESNCLSGVENVADYRKEILTAAENLIAFIGRSDSEFIVPEADGWPSQFAKQVSEVLARENAIKSVDSTVKS